MSDTPLPEDIAELLTKAEADFNQRCIVEETNPFTEALAKYAPKPKTLADYGKGVKWDRTAVFDSYSVAEGTFENGIDIKGAPEALTPWPEIEGINPALLLNDGWQIREISGVPDDWHIFAGGVVDTFTYKRSDFVDVNDRVCNGRDLLAVFCRPPQEETQS